MLQNFSLSKFSKYLLIGISAMVILAAGQQDSFLALAQTPANPPRIPIVPPPPSSPAPPVEQKECFRCSAMGPWCEMYKATTCAAPNNCDACQPQQPQPPAPPVYTTPPPPPPALPACPGSCGGANREGLNPNLNWDWKPEFDVWCKANAPQWHCFVSSPKVAAPPPAPVAPAPLPACPGSCGGSEREGLDSNLNWDWKTEFDAWCKARDGSRAYCYIGSAKVAVPPPACVSDRSCSAPAPACGTTTTGVDNCGKACSKQGAACVVGCVPNTCSVSTPSACGQRNTGVDNCGNVCIKESAACAAAAAPAQGGAITNNPTITNTFNPTNTNTNTNTNTLTVTNPAPQAANVILASAGNVGLGATVSGVQVTTLPKTGLPIFAWTALAFIPAGFRMRRFSQVKKDLENHPSYIFEDRQYKGRA